MKFSVIATTQVTRKTGAKVEEDLCLATFCFYEDAYAYWLGFTKEFEHVPCEYHDDNDKYQRKDFWAEVADFCTLWVHLEVN